MCPQIFQQIHDKRVKTSYTHKLKKGLNKLLVSINILNFVFSPYKIFHKLLVPQIFFIITFDSYF
jgi:hypothetical protein